VLNTLLTKSLIIYAKLLECKKNTSICFEVDFGFPRPLPTHMHETLKLIKFGGPIFGHIDWILEAN
jgi:hypothetical protein